MPEQFEEDAEPEGENEESLADDAATGLCCSECGIYFEEAHGYPVLCEGCWVAQIEVSQSIGLQKATHAEIVGE